MTSLFRKPEQAEDVRLTLEGPSGRIAVDPDVETTGRDTSRGNVARVLASVLGAPQTIGTSAGFV